MSEPWEAWDRHCKALEDEFNEMPHYCELCECHLKFDEYVEDGGRTLCMDCYQDERCKAVEEDEEV